MNSARGPVSKFITEMNKFKEIAVISFVYILMVAAIYYSTIKWLVFHDWLMADYSHCVLVPVIVLYLIWKKRDSLAGQESIPSWKGVFITLSGAVFFLIGELAGEFYTLYLSLWMVVFGLLYINMGWEKIRIILFPLVFSLAMFPFPHFINNRITLQLKLVSSRLGVMMLRALGTSAYREGNIIDLGFTKLQVVDACSGLRYLFPMIVLSILIAYFYKARMWKRLVLVLSTTPLTIISNSLRIALSGVLSEKFGTQAIIGFFHDFEGWLIFMVTLGILSLEIKLLNYFYPEKGEPDREKTTGSDIPKSAMTGPETKKRPFFIQPHVIISLIILSVNLVFAHGIEYRETVSMKKPFSDFPLTLGKWEGQRQFMDQDYIRALDFTDYFLANYSDQSGKAINFYAVYYNSQRKGESIHSPATCLRGSGWVFDKTEKKQVTMDNGTSIVINKALTEKEAVKEVMYYWFPSRGRIITSEIQMKIYNFWDALTKKRTDGALVRVLTQVYPGETMEASEKRLVEFMSTSYPVLNEYLPQ